MSKNHFVFPLFLSLLITLGIVSSALCIASEFKKAKRKDLKLDGKLCYLPTSDAFGFGIGALICLLIAQIIGNLFVCRNLCSIEKRTVGKARIPSVASIFLLLSWVSFGLAAVFISAGTSMNKRQPYGEGWMDGQCYIVKDGVYIGAAILVLFTVGSTLASAIITTRKSQVEQDQKVHAQV